MSQFEVTTTEGHGYVSTNAVTGFKTNESLMDIPQEDLVVTNDMIKDLGYENGGDILQYFGLSPAAQSENEGIRGASIGDGYIDDMPENDTFQDNAYIDSYEIIKGPTEVLYLNAPLSGVVVRATKKPLPYRQNILTVKVDQNGLFRTVLDSTGPLGSMGAAKIGYRLIGVYQSGNTYFMNIKDNRQVIVPELEIDYHNTSARVLYNFQNFHSELNGIDLLTPSGGLYTGAGRKEANQPPNNLDHDEQHSIEIDAQQKISENWSTRLLAQDWDYHRYGGVVLPTGGDDWAKQTEVFNNRIDNQKWAYWTVLEDTTGHYILDLFGSPIKNTDAFGYGNTQWTNRQAYWVTAPFGSPQGNLTVPFNSAAAINAIHVPQPSEYPPPANQGSKSITLVNSIYYQHTVDVIPKWLTLLAAFTWENVQTTNVTNISFLPWDATVVSASQYLHRLGAVLHLTAAVSIYALNSTTFTPPGSGALLASGQLPPNRSGKGNELGLKVNLLGGRISGEFAWYHMVNNNALVIGGTLPNGLTYSIPIGYSVQEGVDGDAALQLLPGWQLITSFYAGHDNTQTQLPLSGTYGNSWSLFNRYDFPKESPLHGLSFGGGVTRIGSRWLSSAGLTGYAPLAQNGIIKLRVGTLVNGFVNYALGRHILVTVYCNNILDQAYPLGAQTAQIIDPSAPRTWAIQTAYRF